MSQENLNVKLNIPSFLLEQGNLQDIENYLTSCLKAELLEQGFDVIEREHGVNATPSGTPTVSDDDFEQAGVSGIQLDSSASKETSMDSSVEIVTDEVDPQTVIPDIPMIIERSEKLRKRVEEFVKTQATFFQSLREENQNISKEINEIRKLTECALKAEAAQNVQKNATMMEQEASVTTELKKCVIANVSEKVIPEVAPSVKFVPESYDFVNQLPAEIFQKIVNIVTSNERHRQFDKEIDFTTLKPFTLQVTEAYIEILLAEMPNGETKSNAQLQLEALFKQRPVDEQADEIVLKPETPEPNVSNNEEIEKQLKDDFNEKRLQSLHNLVVATINSAITNSMISHVNPFAVITKMFEDRQNNVTKTEMMFRALYSAITETHKEKYSYDHITKPARIYHDTPSATLAHSGKILFNSLVCHLYNNNYLDIAFVKDILNDLGITTDSIGKAVNNDCLTYAQEILDTTQEKLAAEHEAYYCEIIGIFFTLKDEVEYMAEQDLILNIKESLKNGHFASTLEQNNNAQQPSTSKQPRENGEETKQMKESMANPNVSNPIEDMEMNDVHAFDEGLEELVLQTISGQHDPESLLNFDYSTIKVKKVLYELLLKSDNEDLFGPELAVRVIHKMFEDRKDSALKLQMLSINLYSVLTELHLKRYNCHNIVSSMPHNPKIAEWSRQRMLKFITIVAQLYNRNYIDFSLIQNLVKTMGIRKESIGHAKNSDTIAIFEELFHQILEKCYKKHNEYYMETLILVMDLEKEVKQYSGYHSGLEASAMNSTHPLTSTPEKSYPQKRPSTPEEPTETEAEKLQKEIQELKLDEEESKILLTFCENLLSKNIPVLEKLCYIKLGNSSLKMLTDQIWKFVLNSRLSNEVPTAVKLLENIFNKLSMNYTKEEAFLEIVQNMAHEKFDSLYTPFIATERKSAANPEYSQQYETIMRLIRFASGLCNAEYLPVSFVKRCVEKLGITFTTTIEDVKNNAGVKIANILLELVQDQMLEQHLEYLFYIQPLIHTLLKEDTDRWDFTEEANETLF